MIFLSEFSREIRKKGEREKFREEDLCDKNWRREGKVLFFSFSIFIPSMDDRLFVHAFEYRVTPFALDTRADIWRIYIYRRG